MMMNYASRAVWMLSVALAGATATPAFAGGVHAQSTFDHDMEGWGVIFTSFPNGLGDQRVDVGGTHGMVFRHVHFDFGVEFRNERNGDFLGDYTRLGAPLKFSFDERNASMEFFGLERGRKFHLQFVQILADGQRIGVSYEFDYVAPAQDWVTHHIVFNPASTTIPPGWTGFNHMNEPVLPAGYTFADVMRDVDMVRITTYGPGMLYHDSWFAVMFDNITLQSVLTHQEGG